MSWSRPRRRARQRRRWSWGGGSTASSSSWGRPGWAGPSCSALSKLAWTRGTAHSMKEVPNRDSYRVPDLHMSGFKTYRHLLPFAQEPPVLAQVIVPWRQHPCSADSTQVILFSEKKSCYDKVVFFFFSWMGFGISQDCPETTSLVWSCPQMNLFQHISTSLQLKAWLKNHTSNWILTAFYSPLLTQILQQLRFPLWSFNLPVTEIQSLSLMLLSRRSHPNHAGQLFSGGTILFRNLGFGNSNKHKSWSWISENQNHNKLHLSPSIFRETDKTQLKNSVLKSVVFGISTSFVCLSRWQCQLYLRGWTRLAGKRRVAALLYPQSRYLSLESGRPEE